MSGNVYLKENRRGVSLLCFIKNNGNKYKYRKNRNVISALIASMLQDFQLGVA
jgi:hypothetical protein